MLRASNGRSLLHIGKDLLKNRTGNTPLQPGRLVLFSGARMRFQAPCVFLDVGQTDAKACTIQERVPQEPLKACVICLPGSEIMNKRNGRHALLLTQPAPLRVETLI